MRFTLTVMPNGKAILSTTEMPTAEQTEAIREKWQGWVEQDESKLLLLGNTDVVQITEIELELS